MLYGLLNSTLKMPELGQTPFQCKILSQIDQIGVFRQPSRSALGIRLFEQKYGPVRAGNGEYAGPPSPLGCHNGTGSA